MDKYIKEAKTIVKKSIGSGNKTSPTLASLSSSSSSSSDEQVTATVVKEKKSIKKMIKDIKTTIDEDAKTNKSQRLNESVSRKKLKSVSKRKTPFKPGFYVKLAKGFYCFFKGTIITFKNDQVRKSFLSALKFLLFSILAAYLLVYFSTFPIKIILFVISKFGFDFPQINDILDPRELFKNIAMFVPLVLIGILRYIVPSFNEDMFFFVMIDENSKVGLFLKNSPILKTYPIIVVGKLVIAVAQFYYSYQPLGQGLAFLLSLLSIIPYTSHFSTDLLKWMMATQSLGKELMEVYYCRLPDVKQEIYVHRRFFGWIFGFSAIWMLVLKYIPYVGGVLWPIACGSSGYLLLKILERNQFKYERGETDVILFGQNMLDSNIVELKKQN
eukprot:gene4966-6187_t